MAMRYTNVKVPAHVAWLDTDEDVLAMLKALVGDRSFDVTDAAIGESGNGPWDEGDIEYKVDGIWYKLAYDFVVIDGDLGIWSDHDGKAARIFRYEIWQEG